MTRQTHDHVDLKNHRPQYRLCQRHQWTWSQNQNVLNFCNKTHSTHRNYHNEPEACMIIAIPFDGINFEVVFLFRILKLTRKAEIWYLTNIIPKLLNSNYAVFYEFFIFVKGWKADFIIDSKERRERGNGYFLNNSLIPGRGKAVCIQLWSPLT